MKKTKLLFLMLLLVVSIGMQAQGGTYEANGVTWKFSVYDGKAIIDGETQGKSAFHGALNIPSRVQQGSQSYTVVAIRTDAFKGYQGATSVTIPDNIAVGSAFQWCGNVESLTLGNNVKGSGSNGYGGPFYGCSKLNSTNIHYPSGELKSIIETGLLQDLNWISGNVEIPEGTTKIEEKCFYPCTALTNVTIPASVQEIGANAFAGCTALTNIIIPTGVQKIGVNAFSGCSSLPSVTLPEGLEEIAGGTFYGCAALTNVTIPTSVKKIGIQAFSGCSSLPSVTLPEGVEEIAAGTFSDCAALTNVTIPASVKKIGRDAFQNCSSLPSVTIPEGVEEIAELTFMGCSALANVTIPASVKKIGRDAFQNCSSLPSVTIPEGVEEIAEYTFTGCSALANVTIPTSVKKIGVNAFSGCSSLPSVTIPEGVEEIAAGTFSGCTALTNVTIPTSVKKIGGSAFSGCSSLTEPHEFHCESIGQGAFAGTGITGDVYIDAKSVGGLPDKATKITLSSKVEYVAYGGNSDMSALEEVVFEPSDKPLEIFELAFRGATKLKRLDLTTRVVPESNEKMDAVFFYRLSHLSTQGIDEEHNEYVYQTTGKPFTLYYLPDYVGKDYGYMISSLTDYDEPNVVWKGKCKNFKVYDTYNYPIIHPFTAVKAQYDRTFNVTDGKAVSTLYLPYPTDLPEGMMAYTLVTKGFDENGDKAFVFHKVPAGTRLEANKPYLVQITDGHPHTLPVMENVVVPVTPTIEATAQQATADANWKFYGTTERIDNAEAYAKKAFYLNDNHWWQVQNGVENDYIAPFRCFVSSPTGAAAAKSFAMVLDGEDSETTGIKELEDSTESDIKSGKYPIYSIDGKLMGKDYDKLEPGQIYIVNGKKFYKF